MHGRHASPRCWDEGVRGAAGDEGMHALKYRSAHETLREDSKLQQAEVGVHDQHVEQLQQRLLAEQVCMPVACEHHTCACLLYTSPSPRD